MFGNRVEDEYANDITAAGAAAEGRSAWPLVLAVLAGLGGFVAWASAFEIEESATARGRVIPSQQVQVIQSLEGGIVRRVDMAEGDVVQAGDVLMRIDDTRFASERGELLEREAALLAEGLRLEAEAAEAADLHFPDELEHRAPLAVGAERALFLSRRDQMTGEIRVLRDQLRQRRAELEELLAERDRTGAILAPLTEEIALTGDLVERGVVPKVDLLRLQSRRAELQGDLTVGTAREGRLRASIEEVEGQIDTVRSAYVLTARQRLAKQQLELAVVQESLRAATDRVRRTQLRAPVTGTVNTIHAKTLGAVVQPGAPLIEIVPLDDTLLIEADLGPRDVAFIRPGAPASVKITAYDYLVYGSLDGVVERIGANTIKGQDGAEFFRVVVRTERPFLGSAEDPLPISPGMVASVDIQTGQRTVLAYLAKPLLRARGEALRER